MSNIRSGSPGATRACPHCKETILESAAVCPQCKHHVRFAGAGGGSATPADVGETLNALRIEGNASGEKIDVIAEVEQHLGENRVRAVAMKPTDGMQRGMTAVDLGEPIAVLVEPFLGHAAPAAARQPHDIDTGLPRAHGRPDRCPAAIAG